MSMGLRRYRKGSRLCRRCALTRRRDTPRLRQILHATKCDKLSVRFLVVCDRALTAVGVEFVSLTEALDLTTPAGRAFAGFLAVFAEFERDVIRERIQAGITDARKRGKAHGRPRAKANDAAQIRTLAQQSLSQAAIARHLGLWRTSVRRVLAQQEGR